MNYQDINCCDNGSIDSLFQKYQKEKETTLSLLKEGKLDSLLWKDNGPLAIDPHCLCRGEEKHPFSCAQCKNIGRISDFKGSFLIECGQKQGQKLMLEKTEDNNHPFFRRSPENEERWRFFSQRYHLDRCGTPWLITKKCFVSDKFTQRILVSWIIEDYLEKRSLKNYIVSFTAYHCRNIGISVTEVYEPFRNITFDRFKVKNILWQLLLLCTELQQINFVHGNPNLDSLAFKKGVYVYNYRNIKIVTEVLLCFCNFYNSSVSYHDSYLSPKEEIESFFLSNNLFVPDIQNKKIESAYCSDYSPEIPLPENSSPLHIEENICKNSYNYYYYLSNSTFEIFQALRFSGFPLFSGSFDFYAFFVAMMQDKKFRSIVSNDPKLYGFWSFLWSYDDRRKVEEELEKMSNIEILRYKWLRCDILQLLWKVAKEI